MGWFFVYKEWLFEAEENNISVDADIVLECQNVYDGDGVMDGDDMTWTWQIQGDSSRTAMIYPDYECDTVCAASEYPVFSAVEADNGCSTPIPIAIGDADKSCTIVNTVFFEGIPTLNDYGLLLFALLMLTSGFIAVRRV